MGLPESFSRLCHSYLNLSDRFQQLDVEYMGLKARLIPLLHTLNAQQDEIEALKHQNQQLSDQLDDMTANYERLKPMESLMSDEKLALLQEAEEQADLVDETLREMDNDGMPGLTPRDRDLLEQFYAHPERFAAARVSDRNGHHSIVEAVVEPGTGLAPESDGDV